MATTDRVKLDAKFDNCIIRYKSGDDESFINHVYDRETKKEIKCTTEEIDALEYKYNISEHDHDRHSGQGRIVVTNGHVTEDKYSEDDD